MQDYILPIAALCRTTSAAILRFYGQKEHLHVQEKSNHTPLTNADLTAHRLLSEGLPNILPLPVVSEESSHTLKTASLRDYWLIDPIDGTKEFIAQTGEFCICIARIYQHHPIFGLIYAPTTHQYWYAIAGEGAYTTNNQGITKRLFCRRPNNQFTVITAKPQMHQNIRQYLHAIFPDDDYQHIACGSALKFCFIAEGKADLYPKLAAKTCEWDTAAGDILLHEAQGGLRYLGNTSLRYGIADDPLNPPFLAFAHCSEERIQAWFEQISVR